MIQKKASKSRKSVHFNARLPRGVSDRLKGYAERRRVSTSAAAVELLDEALRMQEYPGVDFRWTAIGRQPFITGTGLTVWELVHVLLDHGKDVNRVLKNYRHLNAAQVNAAMAYGKAFRGEEPSGFWGKKPPFAREVRV